MNLLVAGKESAIMDMRGLATTVDSNDTQVTDPTTSIGIPRFTPRTTKKGTMGAIAVTYVDIRIEFLFVNNKFVQP